jgi:hypothetical protein
MQSRTWASQPGTVVSSECSQPCPPLPHCVANRSIYKSRSFALVLVNAGEGPCETRPEEDHEAGELYKAEEVLSVVCATPQGINCIEVSSSGSTSCTDAGGVPSTCATATCPAGFEAQKQAKIEGKTASSGVRSPDRNRRSIKLAHDLSVSHGLSTPRSRPSHSTSLPNVGTPSDTRV